MPIGWQIILRRRDDGPLAATPAERRQLAACTLRVLRNTGLLSFGVAGGHGHWPGRWTREEAGQAARALQIGLGRFLGHAGELEPARLRPIHDQRHLSNAFLYALTQQVHHDMVPDPFHEATALPDLLGLRVVGLCLRPRVAERLPALRRPQLTDILGVDPDDLTHTELGCLADAAAAAVSLPGLTGRTHLEVQARAAAVQLASASEPSTAIAAALGISLRSAQRLKALAVPPDLLRAVLGQWRLRSAHLDPTG
jgi:hypothetical protein